MDRQIDRSKAMPYLIDFEALRLGILTTDVATQLNIYTGAEEAKRAEKPIDQAARNKRRLSRKISFGSKLPSLLARMNVM